MYGLTTIEDIKLVSDQWLDNLKSAGVKTISYDSLN